jgi:hypothetical protein
LTTDGADMKPATASYVIDLGCVPVGMLTIHVFLDDNGNADPMARASSDYRDSCGNPRTMSVSIAAGQTSQPTFALANSCD